MSKIKMRCTTCGKWFQSANAKEATCPDCLQKARKEKLAAKATQQTSTSKPGQGGISSSKLTPPPPPKPKEATSGTSHWIDTVEDVKVSQPEQTKSKIPSSPVPKDIKSGTTTERPGSWGPGTYREKSYRGPSDYRSDGVGISGSSQRPRQPMAGGSGRSSQSGYRSDRRADGKPPKAKAPKTPTPPKPKREKIPPPLPFTPTPEQVKQVEVRYQELAVPTEFDGIRTQIAQELGIPKKAVKKIVKDFRERQSIPSWWELQTFKGSSEELEKIRTVYEPYLPLPPIGVHKTIAEELTLNPGDVYQAIKAIRLEMNLPQYNEPSLHGLEPITGDKKQSTKSDEGTKESQEENSQSDTKASETQSESVEVAREDIPIEPVEVISSPTVDNSNTQA